MVERNLAPRTIFNYAVSVQTFLRWIKWLENPGLMFEEISVSDVPIDVLNSLDRNDIYEFLSFCTTERGNTAVSRSAKLSALRSFYRYLAEREISRTIRVNPTLEIDAPKKEKQVPKYMTLDEIRRLLKTTKFGGNNRDYCMFLWLSSCGMRLSELVGVNVTDIRKTSETAELKLRGKGRKERIVPLNSQCVEAWEYYVIERNDFPNADQEKALFLSNRGTRISARRVEQIMEEYLAEAGLQGMGYHVHSLRHSAATNLLKHTSAGLMDVKNMLGHANIASTERYLHLTEIKEDAVSELGNLLT